MEPLRVLQVVTQLNRGGLESFVMNMYRNIDRDRVQFDFLCHRDEEGIFDREARSLGARIYHVPRANPLNPRYYQALENFFSSHPYHIVHSHIDCMSALPLAAARRHGVSVRVAHSHSSRQDIDIKYPFKIICKRFIKYEATDLLACGIEAGKWMFGTNKFIVIHNAIDVDAYRFDEAERNRVRKSLGAGQNTIVVGHVGRFSAVKNHAFLIDVFKALCDLNQDVMLILVGDGELRAQVEGKVQDYGLNEKVHFLGLRSDVPQLMQAMDVFCMPSFYEGLPLVLVEAQAAGLPCLISDSIPDDCDLGCGLIKSNNLKKDPLDWANMIISQNMINSTRSDGAKSVLEAGYDAKSEANILESFYINSINNK